MPIISNDLRIMEHTTNLVLWQNSGNNYVKISFGIMPLVSASSVFNDIVSLYNITKRDISINKTNMLNKIYSSVAHDKNDNISAIYLTVFNPRQ